MVRLVSAAGGAMLVAAFASSLSAATVTYAGADTSTHGSWRTSGVAKPLDADGNNVYGTDGYVLVRSPGGSLTSLPSYVSVLNNLVSEFLGGVGTSPNYVSVDNPAGPGTVVTGTWYASSANGSENDLVSFTLSATASFRLGVLVDNHDFADISPSSLRLRQTVGGSANSGLQTSNIQPNLNGDWYFFDVTGVAGDVFRLSGVNWYNGSVPQASNGIGALSFDAAAVPEPSTFALAVLAFGAAVIRRKMA